MTKRCYIKTIEDVKYCEENNLVIRDAKNKTCSYAFEGNCWVYYLDGQPTLYNAFINLSFKLYYEAPEEPEQEATEDDVGKLCWFYEIDDKRCYRLSVLMAIANESELKFYSDSDRYSHCRPLTKKEIKEFMEKAE